MKARSQFYGIAFLFFCSGAAGLMYEIVWARQFQYLFGSTVFSVSAILSSFFGGLALGSYLLGRWGNRGNPMLMYAVMEGIIGVYGLFSVVLIQTSEPWYLPLIRMLENHFMLAQLLKFVVAAIILLIPCTLMGGTLPVLSRWVQASFPDNSENRISKLYAINTFGAVCGTLVSGFFLIEKLGLTNTVWIGALTNIGIGGVALLYVRKFPGADTGTPPESKSRSRQHAWMPLWAYGLSGCCALAYEVVWTRSLIQELTSSTYTFSAILLLYLLGISLGSSISSGLITRIKSPARWFAWLQIGIALTTLFAARIAFSDLFLESFRWPGWMGYLICMGIQTAVLLLIPTILMGMLFPVMILWWKKGAQDAGDGVGRIYSINTIGGIVGAFGAGFVLLPVLGLTMTMLLLALINGVLGIYFLGRPFSRDVLAARQQLAAVMVLIFGIGIWYFSPSPFEADVPEDFKRLFYKEGMAANVAVDQCIAPGRDFKLLKVNDVYLSGGTDKHAMLVQRRQGHLPMLLHNTPDTVLVIGLATGITLSAIAEHQQVRHLDCVEIVPEQVTAAAYFAEENQNVFADKRINIVVDDGRSFLQSTPRRYNVIVGDLFQIGSAGSGNMYTVEHLQACREHLQSGGMMVQWLPLQQLSERDLKRVLKSFVTVFPFVQLWLCDTFAQKPVLAVVASKKRVRLNISHIRQRIQMGRAASLKTVGYDNPYLVLSQCLMQTENVREYAGDALLNTYDHPVIEFSTPRLYPEERKQRIKRMMIRLLEMKKPLRIEISDDTPEETIKNLNWYTRAHTENAIAELATNEAQWIQVDKMLREIRTRLPEHFDTRRILGRTNVFLAIGDLKRGHAEVGIRKLNTAIELGIDDIFVAHLKKAARKMQAGEKLPLLKTPFVFSPLY